MTAIFDCLLYPWVSPRAIDNPDVDESMDTNNRWKWIVIRQRDSNGNFIANRKRPSEDFFRLFLLDKATDKLYTSDALTNVVKKMALLTIAIPFYTAITMGIHVATILYDLCKNLFYGIGKFFYSLSQGDVHDVTLANFYERTVEVIIDIGEDIWNAARSPLYGMGMELSVIKGLTETLIYGKKKILESKAIMGAIEGNWHEGRTFKDDIRSKSGAQNTLFMAWCFQPRGNINELIGIDTQYRKYEILFEEDTKEETVTRFRRSYSLPTLYHDQ